MVMLLIGRSWLGYPPGYILTFAQLIEAPRRWFPEQRRGVAHPQGRCRQLLDLLANKDSRGHTNAQTEHYSCQQTGSNQPELANNERIQSIQTGCIGQCEELVFTRFRSRGLLIITRPNKFLAPRWTSAPQWLPVTVNGDEQQR